MKLKRMGRSNTRTRTNTSTRTSTSTKAYTQGNITVTGGAGNGATTSVNIRKGVPRSNMAMVGRKISTQKKYKK